MLKARFVIRFSMIRKILLVSIFFIIGVSAFAQDGTYGAYSPYSIYGIGEISKQGTAYNRSMGGVGIAARNRRFINITKHPNLFELKQNESKLRIFAKNIDSISKAHETLSKLLN